jgi:SAM-dependent methyltransferase
MSIIEDYSRQYNWRSWPTILDALPDLKGQLVLDLGCGVGDLAADLAARGAHVIGLDVNEELIAFANGRNITNAEFRKADLRELSDASLRVDGIWSSFTAAYFPSLYDTLESWLDYLRFGGWLALTEVNDLFGHEPLSVRTRELLNGYAADSLEKSRYDFRMGHRIPAVVDQLGMELLRDFSVPDKELSFSGRASSDVIEAWRTRFDRMHLLRNYCGSEFENVRDEFLSCLSLDHHECRATVKCVIAAKNNS